MSNNIPKNVKSKLLNQIIPNRKMSSDLRAIYKFLSVYKPKRNQRRKNTLERIVFHHSLPVAYNIETIDWHLQNLFSNSPTGYQGFKTIEEVTQKEHEEIHKRIGYREITL